ncbi:RING-H2 finger protein [Melia azedarach]|uniref:RING-H2 finger protein n=1 Tax=Melia azedarach TaxID=155640 RepID=A0ACC1YUK5_MELAZ|nr:RING-H2 finger protein [Melia azedarach]
MVASFIIYFFCEGTCWPFSERCEPDDIELGIVSHRARIIAYQAIEVQDNFRTSSSFDSIEVVTSSTEEKIELRQQALEKLLPPVVYGSKETLLSSDDCSVCLDDYRDGEFCRAFPVCNHVFHVQCIDRWLKNHLTCPVCRRCLLDS